MSLFPTKPTVAVIGGGPAGLMAAEKLAGAGCSVTVCDRMPSVGRKFLMAGRGGLNLTHSESLTAFKGRYGTAVKRLAPAIESFPPADLIKWCEGLGQETFVGSSGRVFPKSLKASPLLRAWLRRLESLGVEFSMKQNWRGWDAQGRLLFDGGAVVSADAIVLALGGASWPRLGSDGAWTEILKKQGVKMSPLRPANCGFVAPWSDIFAERFAGEPLKPINLSFGDVVLQGEAMVTRAGLEGGAIYALSAFLRDAIEKKGSAVLTIDLRPGLSQDDIAQRLQAPRGSQSGSNYLRKKTGLPPVAIGLMRESIGGANLPTEPEELAALIKQTEIKLTGASPITRAISSAGGVAWDELDKNYMLTKRPGVFVCGEMLDWEAPTGGYLLQGCFSTAAAAAQGVRDYLVS